MARTWGKIRMELSKFAPGLDLDLANGWINGAYTEILDYRDWSGLTGSATLQTVAIYKTGTVSVTHGGSAIVGTGTDWTANMTRRKIRCDDGLETYTFTFVSSTVATLDRPYEGATGALKTYQIMQWVYPLAADVKLVTSMAQPLVSGWPLDAMGRAELQESNRYLQTGYPLGYCIGDDTSEDDPPVLHTVELTPIPDVAQGIPYKYVKAVYEFDGENTDAYPLPWVSTDAILAKAKACALRHAKDYNGADREEAQYVSYLMQMSNIENTRVEPIQMRMASRFEPRY